MEFLRSLCITVESDTNKDTYTDRFDNAADAVQYLLAQGRISPGEVRNLCQCPKRGGSQRPRPGRRGRPARSRLPVPFHRPKGGVCSCRLRLL